MAKYKSIEGNWIRIDVVEKAIDKKEEVVKENIVISDKDSLAKYDINNDGKVDEKDLSLAGEILSNAKEIKKVTEKKVVSNKKSKKKSK